MHSGNKLSIFVAIVLLISLISCSTTNTVVSKGFFQKRKYNKGWYLNSKNRFAAIDKLDEVKTNVQDDEAKLNEVLATSIGSIKESSIVSEFTNDFITQESQKKNETDSVNNFANESTRLKNAFTKHISISHFKQNNNAFAYSKSDDKINDDDFQNGKDNYRKAWWFTILAIFGLTAFFTVISSFYIGLHVYAIWILLAFTIFSYVMMFIYLVKGGKSLERAKKNSSESTNKIKNLSVLIKAHIIVGSLFSLIFLLIPLIISLKSIKKERKKLTK
jgi:hypothetical protein